MEVQQDFRDLLELFNKYEVDYIIVGAYALGFHGNRLDRLDKDARKKRSRTCQPKTLGTRIKG